LAGLKLLRSDGTIGKSDRVVCILTGHQLKDPTATVAYHGEERKGQYANRPVAVANDLEAIIKTIELRGS
jgi:threonine synthase